MISQPTTKENIIVLTPSGINFLETEKSKPTNQKQDSVKKCLKAEVKVLAVRPERVGVGLRGTGEEITYVLGLEVQCECGDLSFARGTPI